MPVRNREELLAALRSGQFDTLKDTREAQWIDFKDQPYVLNSPASVWEWCKDVASVANGGGGCIVVGVRTEAAIDTREDIAVAHTLVPKNLVNIDQHYSLLREHLVPEPRGLRMQWFPPDGDRGILLIEIPQQDERDLPFLVRRAAQGSERGAVAIAVPTRTGADTAWHTSERLHRILNDDRLRGATTASEREWDLVRRGRMDARVQELERECGWADVPCLFLQAAPPKSAGLIADMHEELGVRGALLRPDVIRNAGFTPYPGRVEVREAGLAMVGPERQALWLEKDGLLTAGGVITGDWFARDPRRSTEQQDLHINSLVLCEYALEFIRFVYRVLIPRTPTGPWLLRVVARGLKSRGGGTKLSPGDHRDVLRIRNARAASTDAIDESFNGSGSAGKDAFTAVAAIYAHYGLPPSSIPFTSDGAVSVQAIQALPMFG